MRIPELSRQPLEDAIKLLLSKKISPVKNKPVEVKKLIHPKDLLKSSRKKHSGSIKLMPLADTMAYNFITNEINAKKIFQNLK